MGGFDRFRNKLLAKVLTRFPSLARKAADGVAPLSFENTPWVNLTKPLAEMKLALVTTAGVHLADDVPFDMVDPTGDPSLRVVPSNVSLDRLAITHDYYDHTDADRDINIVFPIDRLKEFVAERKIGALTDRFYGFMGHIKENHFDRFLNDQVPRVADMMKEDGADVALITPG